MRIEKLFQSRSTKTFYKDPGHHIAHHPTGPAESIHEDDEYWFLDNLRHKVTGPYYRCDRYKVWRVQTRGLLEL